MWGFLCCAVDEEAVVDSIQEGPPPDGKGDLNSTDVSGSTARSLLKCKEAGVRLAEIARTAGQQKKRLIEGYVKAFKCRSTKNNYLIEFEWTSCFSAFIKSENPELLLPICNRKLLGPDGRLKPSLVEDRHFVKVNEFIHCLIAQNFRLDVQVPAEAPVSLPFDTPCGLKNSRFLCYLNAGVQLLLSVPEFVEYFSSMSYQNDLSAKVSFCEQTCKMLKEVSNSKGRTVAIESFQSLMKRHFSQFEQHDCQQFLKFYFQKIKHELQATRGKREAKQTKECPESEAAAFQLYSAQNSTIVDKLFTSFVQRRVVCGACSKARHVYEGELQLNIPLNSDISLEQSIRNWLQEEAIDDKYQCGFCKSVQRGATLKQNISRLPVYLIVYVLRFKPNGKKSHFRLTFQENLALGQILSSSERLEYGLTAVVKHVGKESFGHYVAFVKRRGGWFQCNDDSIAKRSAEEVLGQEAYILLYKMKK